jgi:hypothetical protein
VAFGAELAEIVRVVRIAFDLDHHSIDAMNENAATIAAHLTDARNPDVVMNA